VELRFNKQFLLSAEKPSGLESWQQSTVGNFHLYAHPNLIQTVAKRDKVELKLLGYWFDYAFPEKDNQTLLNEAITRGSFEEITRYTDRFSGQFILIYFDQNEIKLISDAAGQKQAYYDTDYMAVASQIKLLGKSIKLEVDKSEEAEAFYSSAKFKKDGIFVSNKTHCSNVLRLSPNHALNLTSKSEKRFFPYKERVEKPLDTVANEVAKRLQGFIKAASHRNNLAIALTSGFDSRIFFSASHKWNPYYFIFKHKSLDINDPDVQIPKKILKNEGHDYHILEYDEKGITREETTLFEESIDFPRWRLSNTIFNAFGKHFPSGMVLNGNVSEIGRNMYDNISSLDGKTLAYMIGYKDYPYVQNAQESWLNASQNEVEKFGYNILDFFYWEEKIPNWAGKLKSEVGLVSEVYSPFNSRELLDIMLSCNRRYRHFYISKLHYEIIKKLYPDALKYSINPSLRITAIKILSHLGLYKWYRRLGLKYRLF
jgi:hypothetical protein